MMTGILLGYDNFLQSTIIFIIVYLSMNSARKHDGTLTISIPRVIAYIILDITRMVNAGQYVDSYTSEYRSSYPKQFKGGHLNDLNLPLPIENSELLVSGRKKNNLLEESVVLVIMQLISVIVHFSSFVL